MDGRFYRKFFIITGAALAILAATVIMLVLYSRRENVMAQETAGQLSDAGPGSPKSAHNDISDDGQTVMIFSPIDPEKAVNVQEGSLEENANIELMQQNNLDRQIFRLRQTQEGEYLIENAGSGLVLTVENDNSAPEANVVQAQDNGSPGQRWEILSDGDGLYVIRSKLGTYLDLYSGNAQDGTNIWTYSENDSLSQRWIIRRVTRYDDLEPSDEVLLPDGIYKVAISLDYHSVMEVAGGAYEDGAGLCIGTDQDSPEQTFRLIAEDDGYYSIRAVHSGKALEIAGESSQPEADLVQNAASGSDAQKWKLYYAGDDHVYICSALGTYIDLAGGDTTPGTKIWLYSLNGSHSQMWDLFLVEEGN